MSFNNFIDIFLGVFIGIIVLLQKGTNNGN